MPRSPRTKVPKINAEALLIENLSQAVAQAGSRMEDLFWQTRLDSVLKHTLENGNQQLIDEVSKKLSDADPSATEVFIETIETLSTCITLQQAGQQFDFILLSIPVLAYSRFDIASGPIKSDIHKKIEKELCTHVLATGSEARLLPGIFCLEDLPPDQCAIHQFLTHHASAMLEKKPLEKLNRFAQPVPYLADTRYLLVVVKIQSGAPVFKWQECAPTIDIIEQKLKIQLHWQLGTEQTLQKILPGCGVEVLLPDAYYTACREADFQIRPVALNAALFYLCESLNLAPQHFDLIIAPFGSPDDMDILTEYRISFLLKNTREVIYGVIWPLYRPEEQISLLSKNEDEEWQGEIINLLESSSINEYVILEEIFMPELCDDCGIPLFADDDGELVHPEMPEKVVAPGASRFH